MNKPKINTLVGSDAIPLGPLQGQLRDLIVKARAQAQAQAQAQALRAVGTIQVQTCWQIGPYIMDV